MWYVVSIFALLLLSRFFGGRPGLLGLIDRFALSTVLDSIASLPIIYMMSLCMTCKAPILLLLLRFRLSMTRYQVVIILAWQHGGEGEHDQTQSVWCRVQHAKRLLSCTQ